MTPEEAILKVVAESSAPVMSLLDVQKQAMALNGVAEGDWQAYSSAARRLVETKQLTRIKKGKAFYVSAGPQWGERVDMAHQVLAEVGGFRCEYTNRVSAEMWQLLWSKYRDGELDLCFVPSRAQKVGYQVEKGEPTIPLPFWDGLKYNQGRGHVEDVV